MRSRSTRRVVEGGDDNPAAAPIAGALLDAVEKSAQPEEELANQVFEFEHNENAWQPEPGAAGEPPRPPRCPPPHLGDSAVERIRNDWSSNVLELAGALLHIRCLRINPDMLMTCFFHV